MAEMNQEFLQHEGATDVITFSYLNDGFPDDDTDEDDLEAAGEIFVCPQIALESAGAFEQTLDDEIVLYLVHGLLHMSGLDDQTDEQRQAMRQGEATVMAQLKPDIEKKNLFKITT